MSNERKGKRGVSFTAPSASEESFFEILKFFENPLLTDEEIMGFYEARQLKLGWSADGAGTFEGLRQDKWLVGPIRKLVRTEAGYLALALGMQIHKSDYDEYAQRIAQLIKGEVEKGTAVEDKRWLVVDGERLLLWDGGVSDWEEWGVFFAKLQSFSEKGDEILQRLYAEIDWRKTATR
ncbi:MAG: hypothetical protein BGO12_16350 [Verrucomicrobia bacterium 61-8]|nr:hypothetical protein [Verrucomicrobiota bacterium]OJV16126.1 MAG: hypothetical protein BGO12_16350 [Verrucomicrobia bacterium 61-8]